MGSKKKLFVDSNWFSREVHSSIVTAIVVSFEQVILRKLIFKRYCFWGVFGDGQKKVLQSQIWFHEWKSKNYAVGWFCKIEFFGDCYCGFYVSLYGWWSLFLFVWLRWMEVFGNNEPTLTLWFCHAFFRLMFFCWRLDTENGALM